MEQGYIVCEGKDEQLFFSYKWARPESNRRSPRCKRDVITTRPLAHCLKHMS